MNHGEIEWFLTVLSQVVHVYMLAHFRRERKIYLPLSILLLKDPISFLDSVHLLRKVSTSLRENVASIVGSSLKLDRAILPYQRVPDPSLSWDDKIRKRILASARMERVISPSRRLASIFFYRFCTFASQSIHYFVSTSLRAFAITDIIAVASTLTTFKISTTL